MAGKGNPQALRNWYDSARSAIGWGSEGDFGRCTAIASKYMTVEQAHGFCQLRHMESVGHPAGRGEGKKGAEFVATTPPELYFSDVSAEDRRAAAKAGHALPDGSYPIANKAHLKSAILLAQSGHGDVTAAKALIRRRAKDLDAEAMIPDAFDEPTTSDVHVNGIVNASGGTPRQPNRHFLNRMLTKLKDKVTPDEFLEAVREARAYAGGTTAQEHRKQPLISVGVTGMPTTGVYFEYNPDSAEAETAAAIPEEIEEAVEATHPALEKSDARVKYRDGTTLGECCSDCKFYEASFEGSDEHECVLVEGYIRPNGVCNLFTSNWQHAQLATSETPPPVDERFFFSEPRYYMEPPTRIPYLPVPGNYIHPSYGKVVITRERNQRFVQNFKDKIYQEELPIDAEHMTKLSGACGYVTDLNMNEDGSVDANVRWTPRGEKLLRDEAFSRFSPEFYDEWRRPDDGQKFPDIAIGGALTTRSFFKSKSLRPLAASEHVLVGVFAPREERQMAEVTHPFDGKHTHAHNGFGDHAATAEDAHEHEHANDSDHDHDHTGGQTTMAENTFAEQFAQLQAENAALKTMTEQATAQQKQMAEIVTAMQVDARKKQFTDEVLGRGDSSGARWYGEVEGHVAFMETLHEKGLTDQLTQYIEMNRTHAEQLVATGLFGEKGRAGTAGNSSEDKLQAMIAAEQAKGLDLTAATEKVMSEHAALYSEYSDAKSFGASD